MNDYEVMSAMISQCHNMEIEMRELRAALRHVISSLELLGEDGWSDAPYLLRECRKALGK